MLIGAVWTLAFLDGVVTNNYAPLGLATPIMLIAAGAIFASRNGGNDEA